MRATSHLLNDDERHQVGLCYKNKGQEHAIEFGHQLVHGEIKQHRVQQWIEFAKQHDNAYLYCFRGGLRSKITQQWLHDAGIDMPRVKGGYKALRQFLVHQIDQADKLFNFVLVGGLTGCKKTHLINQLDHGIDLEGAAYHRGSSFGAHATAQSSQINFENKLSVSFLRAEKNRFGTLVIEDESRFIGSVDIPKNVFNKMRCSPLIVIEDKIETRLQQLLQEYVIDMEQEFNQLYNNPEQAFEAFSEYLLTSLHRIRKRLGGLRWQSLNNSMQDALAQHKQDHDLQQHLNWLRPLLTEYYDPMYRSQLSNRSESIIFRGNYNECYDFLNQYKLNN